MLTGLLAMGDASTWVKGTLDLYVASWNEHCLKILFVMKKTVHIPLSQKEIPTREKPNAGLKSARSSWSDRTPPFWKKRTSLSSSSPVMFQVAQCRLSNSTAPLRQGV